MFTSLGQWVHSLGNKTVPEHFFTKINFEDVLEVIHTIEEIQSIPVQSKIKRHSTDVAGGSEEEEDLREEIDASTFSPLIITTIPLSFFTYSHHDKTHDAYPLIKGTLTPEMEEYHINHLLDTLDTDELPEILIILYGQNATDVSVFEKAKQLRLLGFSSIYIYSGGMFEWCLLQDIYGNKDFPVDTGKAVDPLQYKGKRIFHP